MRIGNTPITATQPASQINVGFAVLAKSLDTIETAGQSMIKMMEQSVQPYLGRNIDVKA